MKALLRLWPYFQQYAWAFWSGISGLLIARIFEAMIPLYVKEGIDAIADGQQAIASGTSTWALSVDTLSGPALAIVLCVLAQMAVTIVSRILIRRIGMTAAFDLRNRVYSHLQRQGPGFFGQYTIGDLMARSINDISLIRQFIAGTTRMTMVLIFTASVGLIFMFSLSVELTLAVLAPMPLITLVAWYYSKRIYAQSHQVQEGFSELSTFVQENLNGIRTVQAMAQEAREVARFDAVNGRFLEYNMLLFSTTSLLGALMPVLAAAGMLVIIGYGSHLVTSGAMTLGTLAAFFSYLALLLWPVREAGSLVTQWQRGASGTARVFEILDYQPEIQDEGVTDYPELTGKVSVQHLSYRYENKDRNALDDISFNVDPGETIAIIGRVGSGKSTLLRLFVRLLDPTSGELLLDDHPIREYPLAYLREQVCLVLQDPFLFADSLGDNIAYDDPERHESEILESADAAALSERISHRSCDRAWRARGDTLWRSETARNAGQGPDPKNPTIDSR
jgi:ATP-binding cassette subfamily B protein